MSIDFILYIGLLILGFFYLLTKSKGVFFFYLIILICFILVIRIEPKGIDFTQYYRYLHFVPPLRLIREFAYFLLGLGLFRLFNNEVVTFIAMDLIWLYILFKGQREINKDLGDFYDRRGLIVILFTSFPLFFGYENIYRQLFAQIFSLYAYIIRERKERKSNLFFLISIFMHNTALLILPLLTIKKLFNFNFKKRFYISSLLAITLAVLSFMFSNLKSGHNTGVDMAIVYYLIFIMGFLFMLFINQFRLDIVLKLTPSLYICTIMMTSLIFLPVGMVAERMGMFFLIFVIADLYRCSNGLGKNTLLVQLLLFLIFSLPVIIFSSSRSMLETL